MNTLLLALIAVESSGRDLAVGDDFKAVGCLQIHREVVLDVNAYNRTRGKPIYVWPHDCFSRSNSVAIFHTYQSIYCTKARLGRSVTDEDAARIWNGGPRGYQKKATIPYWERTQAAIKQLKTNQQKGTK